MEPMITGSPDSQSPYRLGRHASEHRTPDFLPAYLMGASSTIDRSKVVCESSSCTPSGKHSKVTWSPELNHTMYFDTNNGITPHSVGALNGQQKAYNLGGPPTASLFADESECLFTDASWSKKNFSNGALFARESTSEQFSANSYSDPHLSNEADAVDDLTCVTIFGFTPDILQCVIQQFAQCGTIVKSEIPKKCNWIHVKYQSKLQAKKALERNGRVFNDCVRIGVIPCTDRPSLTRLNSAIESSENRAVLSDLSQNFGTPVRSRTFPIHNDKPHLYAHSLAASENGSKYSVTLCGSKSTMRPLAASVLANNKDQSAANDGLLSRARHYVLGW